MKLSYTIQNWPGREWSDFCAAARDDFEEKAEELRARVKALTGRFPLYEG